MKTYITVVGTDYYYGVEWCKKGKKLKLSKEPDNKYDKEAIRVEVPGLGKIGYVANSVKTVMGDSMSAGRLYDRIGDTAYAEVEYIIENKMICRVKKKSFLYYQSEDDDVVRF